MRYIFLCTVWLPLSRVAEEIAGKRVWMKKKTLLRLMGNGEKTERAGKKTFLLHLKVREISDVLCSALQALLLPKVAASMCRM